MTLQEALLKVIEGMPEHKPIGYFDDGDSFTFLLERRKVIYDRVELIESCYYTVTLGGEIIQTSTARGNERSEDLEMTS